MTTFNLIKELKQCNVDHSIYGSLDIETVSISGIHYPYAAGYRIKDTLIIHHAHKNPNLSIESFYIMKNCIESLLSQNPRKRVYIMVHNLGGFDGVYILKGILMLNDYDPNSLSTLIDSDNNFIEIQYKNLVFRDSYRIFPASLKKLAEICKTANRKLDFDHDSVTLDLIYDSKFYESSLSYLKADINTLYDVINVLRKDLLKDYKIPLRCIYSASNMAFKVYRSSYQKMEIEASSWRTSAIARSAYYGGAVQLTKPYIKEGYYYDVNSLYPYGMLNPMPVKRLDIIPCTTEEFLSKDLFGFVICNIKVPESISLPQVPVRYKGSLIYPYGNISGCYFSEEVKSFIHLGYNVETIVCYTFSKEINLFDDYIHKFYSLKSDPYITPEKRYMVKLMLNGLYGYFARSIKDIIYNYVKDQEFYRYRDYTILDTIEMDNDITAIKYKNVIDQRKMANPAISAAVAAWGRIYMHQFSNMPDNPIIYKDTDSLVLEKPLPDHLIGSGIGQFKLEHVIKEGIFLKPKTYALKTEKGDVVKAAGYPNNSLTFEDFNSILHNSNWSKHISTTKLIMSMKRLCIIQRDYDLVFNIDNPYMKYKIDMIYDLENLKSIIVDLKEF